MAVEGCGRRSKEKEVRLTMAAGHSGERSAEDVTDVTASVVRQSQPM